LRIRQDNCDAKRDKLPVTTSHERGNSGGAEDEKREENDCELGNRQRG